MLFLLLYFISYCPEVPKKDFQRNTAALLRTLKQAWKAQFIRSSKKDSETQR